MTSMNYIKKSYIQPSAAIIVNLTTEFLAASGKPDNFGNAMYGRTKGTDMCTWEDEEDEVDDGEYREYEVQWNYGW